MSDMEVPVRFRWETGVYGIIYTFGQIFVNGKTAERMYKRYLQDICGQEAVVLPSTSPANAAWRLPDLVSAWKKAVEQTVGIESLK